MSQQNILKAHPNSFIMFAEPTDVKQEDGPV